MVLRSRSGQSVAAIAVASGISVRTVYKWLKRYRDEGVHGLSNKPGTPRSNPHAYLMGWRGLIEGLRRYRMTALEIAMTLDLPRSSVALALKRLALNRLSRLTPPEPVRRYERKRPGDLIHLDIEKLEQVRLNLGPILPARNSGGIRRRRMRAGNWRQRTRVHRRFGLRLFRAGL